MYYAQINTAVQILVYLKFTYLYNTCTIVEFIIQHIQ